MTLKTGSGMGRMKKLLLFFFMTGITSHGTGQVSNGTLRLSISEAQTYAQQNNRTVQSSKINIDFAGKKIWENLALGLPQINVDANYLHQFVVPEISFGPYLDIDALPDGPVTKADIEDAFKDSPPIPLGVPDNTTIDFTLSQLIFNGQYFVGLKAAKVVKQVSEKALVKTEDQTKELVAGAYYLLLVLQENIRVLKETQKSLDQTYNEMVRMNQQGLNEETDVDQVNINRSNITTLLTTIGSRRETSLKLFKYLLGVSFEKPVELTDNLEGIIEQGNLRYLSSPEFRIDNSVDYQLAGIQENLSELMLKLEKSTFLPSVSAFYRHQEQTNQPSFNFAVKDVIGANLHLPILSSGMRSAKISQARLDLEKVRLNKQDTEQGLIMEFETARTDYQSAYSNYTVNRESMALSKKVYDRTIIKYREGVSSSFELSQIQNQFLTAESNYYNSLLSLLNAKAKLDRILRIN